MTMFDLLHHTALADTDLLRKNNELGDIFARLNVPFEGDLGVRKKGHFRTDRTPYQLVFTPKQRQMVERVFAREIQLHGYRFEQTANG